ncbi:MAG: hypothetical protein RIM99_07705 [Cyclobacteriaceae bacterium]
MKILTFLFVCCSFAVHGQDQKSEALLSKGMKKYPIESGVLNYEISGGAKGTESLTFDRFGWRSLKRLSMQFELYGQERSRTQHEISDGEILYRVNQQDSTYQERVDVRWSSIASQMSPIEASESILFSLGGTYTSDSVLLGKTCQVWTFENKSLIELWVWQGLTLKRKSRLGELVIVATATGFKEGIQSDPRLFILPEFYILKE